jgi:hypothetical protein
MRDRTGDRVTDTRRAQFARALYFDLQTIDGVKPLEIWNGFREMEDPYEKAGLVKNLYKIVVPLVNERCYGRPFAEHSRLAYETVAAAVRAFSPDRDELTKRFPWPPTGDADQKELYLIVKDRAGALLAELDEDRSPPPAEATGGPELAVVPDGLFDFREMRLVDNEFPYIIFTEKEFRVIHGMAIVYLWLIEVDTMALRTLEDLRVDAELVEACRVVGRKVQRENPLIVNGIRLGTRELIALIQERVRGGTDYLDLFENVYAWFEETRRKLVG